MDSRYQTNSPLPLQPADVLVPQSDPALNSAAATDVFTRVPVKGNPYGDLMRYDEIWAKMMMMCKKLRNMMNEYNAQRQAQAWTLDVNALVKTRDGIEKAFQAAVISSAGGVAGGVCSMGGTATGFRAVKNLKQNPGENLHSNSTDAFNLHQGLGRDSGQFINSGCAAGASGMTKEADTAKAEAELLHKSAHAYDKTQDELQAQAKDIMRQMLEMGQRYVEQYSQALQHLVR
ncbi:Translocation machinery component [Sodalis praecaptivus]|uniref:Translocation machinery component n=1 Tax=Sodalis praecaptivus TaxID=1239307 RepID=W0HX45_9GAMM|nr:hypothetical protein [Sodalis praecaptivus]AHF76780.1 Translocation machinery component [Sodalis praecaptivus]